MTNQSVTVRMARESDAPELLKIYAPYVMNTNVTFEYTVPSEEAFAQRISGILRQYPYLVAEQDGRIAGYTYASAFRQRAAYIWSAESSIYINDDFHRRGIGKLLYTELERILRLQNVTSLSACIAYPNTPSINFHKSLGFERVARFSKCAYKRGQWVDIIWMQKAFTDDSAEPAPFVPLPEIPAELLNV
ncbi:MAG: GNAT family N-acetyltransferase [Oscillospiraceae bacterium]